MPTFSLDGSSINIFIALLAGFITFFASCLLPLVPTYLAYLSGISLTSSQAGKKRWFIVQVASFFVLGFVLTFVGLGLTLNQLASPILFWRPIVEKLAGGLFIILGLFMLGFFSQSWLINEHRIEWKKLLNKIISREKSSSFERWMHRFPQVHAFLAGIGFGFGWSPCIGPVLAVILLWASQTETIFQGVLLLTAYGVGLGIPFLLVAMMFESLVPFLKKSQRLSSYLTYFAALVIIVAGILMILGSFQTVSMIILGIFGLRRLAL